MNARAQTEGETIDHKTGEVVPAAPIESNLAVGMVAAEINQQIATARAFPRSIAKSQQAILDLATLDEETAKECMYSVPREGKAIEGASVRLAEIIYQSWGNCRVGGVVTHVDREEKVVIAEGFYHDLETNAATRVGVRRRISGKSGRIYSDDMIITTGNAATAIAKRNAVLSGVPKGIWRPALLAVRKVIMGELKTLASRRAAAIVEFQRFGVTAEQLFEKLEVAGEADITLEHMPTLIGMFSAIKNGEETVEGMFSAKGGSGDFKKVDNPLSDKPANGAPKQAEPAAPQSSQEGQGAAAQAAGAGAAPQTAAQPKPAAGKAAEPAKAEPAKPSDALPAAASKDAYAARVKAMIAGATSAAKLSDTFKADRKLRNDLGFTADEMEGYRDQIDAAVAALKAGT